MMYVCPGNETHRSISWFAPWKFVPNCNSLNVEGLLLKALRIVRPGRGELPLAGLSRLQHGSNRPESDSRDKREKRREVGSELSPAPASGRLKGMVRDLSGGMVRDPRSGYSGLCPGCPWQVSRCHRGWAGPGGLRGAGKCHGKQGGGGVCGCAPPPYVYKVYKISYSYILKKSVGFF